MKIIRLLLLKILFLFIVFSCSSQSNIHYYGWDSAYSHSPRDIIQTQDGGFLINSDVYSSQPYIENYISRQFLIHTNIQADTLWCRYFYHQRFGNAMLLQLTNNNFISFGRILAGFECNMVGSGMAFSDFSFQTYSQFGDSLNTSPIDVDCNDDIIDCKKNQDGSMTFLTESSDVYGNNYSYSIKEVSSIGNITTIPISSGYFREIEKSNDGYWISSYNYLYKYSSNGNLIWSNPILFIPHVSDFCKVNNDSLVFIYSSGDASYGDSVHVVKTDSIGNPTWNKKYFLRANDIFLHSSGNYIITGKCDSNLVVLALNSNGDSIWGKNYLLQMPAIGIKTIEYSNGRLAVLGRAGGIGLPSKVVLVLDSCSMLTTSMQNENILQNNIKINPNPTSDVFSISLPTKFNVEIFNVNGQIIKTIMNCNEEIIIDLKGFPNGLYILKVKTNNKIYTSKLIKR